MENQVTGFRLSPQQRRLWLLAQGGLPARAACAVTLEGRLRADALRDALRQVIARHEILRTRFERAPGITLPIQVISETGAATWRELSLADLAPREQAERVEALFGEETRAGLPAGDEAPVRATLLELAGQSHLLLLSVPALSADARSMENLVGELAQAYAACAGGERVGEGDEGPTQYLQFSEWQNELLKEEEAEEGRRFWRQQLGTPTEAVLSIPFERGGAGAGGFAPRSVEVELDAVPPRRLEEAAGGVGARPADFMLACWQALLWRLTGEPAFAVGRTFENRKFEELSGALGPFAGVVPVAARLGEDVRFGEALRRADEASRAAEEWLEYFEWESLGASAGTSSPTPYLPFLFEFRGRGDGRRAAGVDFSLYRHEACGERFKVKLSCAAGGEALAARLEYDSSLYDEADIRRLGRQLSTLAAAALAEPDARLGDLEVLGEEERRRLLVELNQTRAEFPADSCLHELFEAQAGRTPDAVAVAAGDARLTYAELNRKANRLAHHLRASGVGPDVLVGVMLERSAEMVVGLLGVLKAGGAYLPLDPQQPAQRLSFQLEDAGARLILTQQCLLANLPGEGFEAVCLDTDWERVAARSDADPEPLAAPSNLAYVIYTSGSTGRPKGVMVPHRGLVNYLSWCARAYRVGEGAGAPVHSSIGFDLTVTGLFAPLLAGRGVTMLPEAGAVEALAEALAAGGDFSLVKITPAHLELLAGHLAAGGASGSARALVIGGESLAGESLAYWRANAPGTRLINEYGPTETVVGCSIYEVGAEEVLPAVVPIGRPIANTQMYVLDARLRPLPHGVAGEIYVGGEGLARGYMNRPGLTAERFVPNPFGAEPGARLYRTGDLGRFLGGGDIEFLGRLDQQVKVRGFRIELGEIEAVLGRHPALKEAVVLAREDVAGDKRLVAYCVGRQGREPEAAELREHLQSALPDYMIPTAFVMLRALPLTPNGKVDRKALPAPDNARPELRAGYVAPRTPVEEVLAETWAGVLGLKRVGVHDNFFELGGHSLLATQLMSRVHKCFEVEVPLRDLFDGPTVAELARRVEHELGAGAVIQAEPVRPQPRGGAAALSFAQRRLWFLDRLAPGSAAYNVPLAARLDGALDVAALGRALSELVRRHEVLRTSYPERSGLPVQVINPSAELPLELTDVSGAADPEAEAEGLAREEALRPFDLAAGPVARARLVRVAAESHVLLVTLHHIASDGWSASILLREVAALYGAFSQGRPSPLAEPELQYADYAEWQRRLVESGALDSELGYWRERLRGAEVLRLPGGAGGGRRPAGVYRQHLPAELVVRLRELGAGEGATLFMTLLAGFDGLLYRLTGQEDVVVGTPVAGRTRLELEGVVGCFVNTLAVRVGAGGGASFGVLVRRVREATLGAYAHQGAPFERVVEVAAPGREAGREPLLRAVFVMQNVPNEELRLGGLRVGRVAGAGAGVLAGAGAKFDLTVSAEEEPGGGVRVGWEWREGVWGEGEAERVAACYERLLRAAADEPERQLGHLEVLDPLERERALTRWSTSQPARGGETLTQLFEEQARRSPESVALALGGEQLTYGELNARGNRLASHLRAQGVGPEVPVALLFERSFELVVGLLGVLKAGGTYVPLDPLYPFERLSFMLEDSGAAVLLTQQHLLEKLPELSASRVLCLDRDWAEVASHGAEDLAPLAGPDNLAYVIYTSGSTGRPKGVGVTHANVTRLFEVTAPALGFGPEDTWTLFHSSAFDFSVWEIWGALLYGGRLVVVPYWVSRSPDKFRSLLEREGVTVLNQTPSAFRQLMRADEGADTKLSSLRLVVFGGEALDVGGLRAWFERYGDGRPRLVNMYGITETTVHVTLRELGASDAVAGAPSVIGGPLADLRLYVLDPWMGPAPAGAEGELYVGGAGLARGYVGRPALTAERFVPDPFGAEPGARLYRTGDLARAGAGGGLEYAGRADGQVKVRGHRIEVGEVEAALREDREVAEAAVLAEADGAGGARLVAYVAGRGGAAVDTAMLRRRLRERLPEAAVPSEFVLLDALPLTEHGKLDHKALAKLERQRPESAGGYVAPRNEIEEALAAIMAEATGAERVGVYDNFFDLGGDSIRSIQVSAQARKIGLELSVQQLFEFQTVDELARELDLARAGGETLPPTEPFCLVTEQDRAKLPDDVEDAFPLAKLQTGMLFHSAYSHDAAFYHDVFSFHLRAPLDLEVLRSSVRRLASRHPALRTSFDLVNFAEPMQLVHRAAEVPLTADDISHLPAAEQERAVADWMEEEKARRFEWSRPPLMRLHVSQRGADTFQLLLSFHHAILDGWSVATMLTELFQTYRSSLEGAREGDAPPPPSVGMRDFVAAERAITSKPEARAFWAEKLSDITVTRLPRRPDAPAPGGSAVGSHYVEISDELSDALKRTARAASVPVKSLLLAAHLRTLSVLGGHTDVLTGVISHGRPESAEGAGVLGLYLNSLPLRQKLKGGTWLELAQQTFRTEREMMPFRLYPLALLQNEAGGGELFDTNFNFIHFHVYQGMQSEGFMEVLEAGGFEQTNFALAVHFSQDPKTSRVGLRLDYQTDSLSREQVEAVGGYYLSVLGAAAYTPESRYETFSPLAPGERRSLLEEWNATRRDYAPGATFHSLFEAQAAAKPDAPALVHGERRLSYGELNARADRLANHLRGLGVGPESRVGVLMGRSPELVVSLLGVLKSGGAYVPLDPQYPQERLRFMLEDSSVEVLLTQESLARAAAGAAPRVVAVEEVEARPAGEPAQTPGAAGARPDNLAYVIYTSGSTGRPKGVAVTHSGLVNYVRWAAETYPYGGGGLTPVHSSISFDLTVTSLHAALATGGCVELLEEHPDALGAALREGRGYDVVKLTPAHLQMLNSQLSGGQAEGVKALVVGGENLLAEVTRAWGEKSPATRIFNEYGPTETVVGCCVHEAREAGEGSVPVGRPVANTRIYVLDEHMLPAPAGVAGELYVGGAGVARGYLNRPGLTAERFVPDPFGAEPGARLYRTGDLARHRHDGELEFLGRVDHQVKVRGYRVELGEVEAALLQHASVRECVVVVDAGGGAGAERLVAYVVPARGQSPSAAALQEHLRMSLPAHMIPAVFVTLDELPLTPGGKLDRRALPDPEGAVRESGHAFVAPRNAIEAAVAELWRELLRVEQVSMDDNFIELGGHSLLLTQLAMRIGKAFQVNVPLRELLDGPTVAEMSKTILTKQAARVDESKMAEMMKRLKSLSPEEMRAVLEAEGKLPDPTRLGR